MFVEEKNSITMDIPVSYFGIDEDEVFEVEVEASLTRDLSSNAGKAEEFALGFIFISYPYDAYERYKDEVEAYVRANVTRDSFDWDLDS